jgi:hypothetical protein
MIVEILVALHQSHHPLGKKMTDFMFTSVWVSVVGKTAGCLLEEVHLLGDLTNQKSSGVGGDTLSGKLGLNAAISQAFK